LDIGKSASNVSRNLKSTSWMYPYKDVDYGDSVANGAQDDVVPHGQWAVGLCTDGYKASRDNGTDNPIVVYSSSTSKGKYSRFNNVFIRCFSGKWQDDDTKTSGDYGKWANKCVLGTCKVYYGLSGMNIINKTFKTGDKVCCYPKDFSGSCDDGRKGDFDKDPATNKHKTCSYDSNLVGELANDRSTPKTFTVICP
jgi:hypothetical protein